MDFIIPGFSVKTFQKILVSLSKFGDKLSLRGSKENLVLTLIDPSHAAVISFGFRSDFFSLLQLHEGDTLTQEYESMMCQVDLKPLIDFFRSCTNTHDKPEKCSVTINDNIEMGVSESLRLTLSMEYPHSLIRRFRLPFHQSDIDLVHVPRPSEFQGWTMGTELLLTLLSHFDIRLEEFTILARPGTVQFISHHNDSEAALKPANQRKQLHTGLTFHTSEFNFYEVNKEIGFTMRVKEFKAVLAFAKEMDTPLSAAFTKGGDPIFFTMHFQTAIMADYILSTSEPSDFNIITQDNSQYASFVSSQQPIKPTRNWYQSQNSSLNFPNNPNFFNNTPLMEAPYLHTDTLSSSHILEDYSLGPQSLDLSFASINSEGPNKRRHISPSQSETPNLPHQADLSFQSAYKQMDDESKPVINPPALDSQTSIPPQNTQDSLTQATDPDIPASQNPKYPSYKNIFKTVICEPDDTDDEFYVPGTP